MRVIDEIKALIEIEHKGYERYMSIECPTEFELGMRTICRHNGTRLQSELLQAITDGIPTDRLEAICQAERENRCVVLPCKVGDRVYWADNLNEPPIIRKGYVSVFSIDDISGKLWVNVFYDDGLRFYHCANAYFGKTVFLTQAAAEQAITAWNRREDE